MTHLLTIPSYWFALIAIGCGVVWIFFKLAGITDDHEAGVGVSVPPVVGETGHADAGVYDWETA